MKDALFTEKGVEKDVKQAFFWIEKAAIQGHHMAEYLTGLLLRNGAGCRKSIKRAKEYLEKASAGGVQEDQEALAEIMHGNG